MWINIAVAVTTLLVYLGPFINPKDIWVFTLAGMGYPYLLGINVLFVLLWASFRKMTFLISFLTISVGLAHVDRLIGFEFSRGYQEKVEDVKVLSFNAQSFLGKKKLPQEFLDLSNTIRNQDIVLLQEIPQHIFQQIRLEFKELEAFKTDNLGLVIFSKFKIVNSGVLNRLNASNGAIWADLKINNKIVRVYNIHLNSYRVTKTTDEILDGEIADEKTWLKIGSLFNRIKETSQLRSDQVAIIENHLLSCDKPLILAGDFNDTPVSHTYHVLSRGLQDTFSKKGRGVGTTYAGKIPLLRIDYIFADSNFAVHDHEVIQSPLSDHYPIKSVIRLQSN